MSPERFSSSDAPLVTLERVEKRYGDRVALRVERLELRRGDCMLITGPNGSGKSTLLRVLSGVSPPSRGRVSRTLEFESLRLCHVPQTGGLYGHLTLADNIRLSARLFGADDSDDVDRRWYVRRLGLARYLDARCEDLSGGYRRLAAIACAYAAQPQGLFVDEPLSGIDRSLGDALLEGIESSRDALAFVVMTHHSAHGFPSTSRVVELSGESGA